MQFPKKKKGKKMLPKIFEIYLQIPFTLIAIVYNVKAQKANNTLLRNDRRTTPMRNINFLA